MGTVLNDVLGKRYEEETCHLTTGWTICRLRITSPRHCQARAAHLEGLRPGCGGWSEASANKTLANAASGGEDGGCVE